MSEKMLFVLKDLDNMKPLEVENMDRLGYRSKENCELAL